jgi:transketolase
VYLYCHFLNIDRNNLEDPQRDYLLLSKGHDVPALYGVLAELDIISRERLANHLKTNDHIYWHPNSNIPGIEFHSGSLGHLMAVASGIAMDCRIRGQKNKVVVITGDGELDEGSCWETALVAGAHKLDNLVVVVDRNSFQANIETEKLIPLEPLQKKFETFGFHCVSVDGHDFSDLHNCFSAIPLRSGRPLAVIANTRRGKGLPSIEARADRWFCNFSHAEIEQLLIELREGKQAEITSEKLIVR